MHNRTAAEVVGVNVDRISMIVFGIGMALAGAAGSLLSFLFSFYPSKHWEWVGDPALAGRARRHGEPARRADRRAGLSVIAAFVDRRVRADLVPLTFYLALFVILLVRPQGLLGKKPESDGDAAPAKPAGPLGEAEVGRRLRISGRGAFLAVIVLALLAVPLLYPVLGLYYCVLHAAHRRFM